MNIIAAYHPVTPSNYCIGITSLYKYEGLVYTGLPFSSVIYQIDAENMIPVMELSFGSMKLPPTSLVVDEKENSLAWLNRVVKSDYINSFHVHETTDHVGVSFYGQNFQRHLGFYDKKNEIAHAYTASKFMQTFRIYGVYDIINTHNDYFVARIEPRMLKKYIPSREDLRLIASERTEEDNPVLCLFKFK